MKLLISFIFIFIIIILNPILILNKIDFSDYNPFNEYLLVDNINYELPSYYDHLSIEVFLKELTIKNEIKKFKQIKFNIKQKKLLDKFDAFSIKGDFIDLHKMFFRLNSIIISFENRKFLFSIRSKIVKRQKDLFNKKRRLYSQNLNKRLSHKYININYSGKNNDILICDWYYFANKKRRHDFYHKYLSKLKELHFKQIKFKNSINHKNVIYVISSKNDSSFY